MMPKGRKIAETWRKLKSEVLRNFILKYESDQNKEGMKNGTLSMHRGDEKCISNCNQKTWWEETIHKT
jgi:hypothetical protein